MATTKPTFAKMGLKINTDIKTITIGEQEIEVKQYLPINDKLELIGRVIALSADDNNFANPIKLDVFTSLEIVFAYTNIQFTEKQKEDLVKLYDIMESNDIFNIIIANIPDEEYASIVEGVELCASAIYTYRHSVLGIIETIAQDYKNLDMDASAIQAKLADPQNMELLKNILDKLG